MIRPRSRYVSVSLYRPRLLTRAGEDAAALAIFLFFLWFCIGGPFDALLALFGVRL